MPKPLTKTNSVVCLGGIAAAVTLAALHLVSGPAAVASIVAICLRTDATTILNAIKGKEENE